MPLSSSSSSPSSSSVLSGALAGFFGATSAAAGKTAFQDHEAISSFCHRHLGSLSPPLHLCDDPYLTLACRALGLLCLVSCNVLWPHFFHARRKTGEAS